MPQQALLFLWLQALLTAVQEVEELSAAAAAASQATVLAYRREMEEADSQVKALEEPVS